MKIPSRWSNFFYTLTAFNFLMLLQMHITSGFLKTVTIMGIGVLALVLAASQAAFAFTGNKNKDWFAALSSLNLFYVFFVYLVEFIIFLGGSVSHLPSIYYDLGIFMGLLSITFIWISSEGFVNLQSYLNVFKKKELIIQEKEPNLLIPDKIKVIT